MVTEIIWICDICQRECFPIRAESLCICNHKKKYHKLKQGKNGPYFACTKCKCNHFFFIIQQGHWRLRCSCKHAHHQHNFSVRKSDKNSCNKCNCQQFISPWVCNCDHKWSEHTLKIVKRPVKTLEQMIQQADDLSSIISRGF